MAIDEFEIDAGEWPCCFSRVDRASREVFRAQSTSDSEYLTSEIMMLPSCLLFDALSTSSGEKSSVRKDSTYS